MIYYIIRHKLTKEIMPQMKRNRGYSHWNPSKPDVTSYQELKVPRILESKSKALRCISQWNACPNAHRGFKSVGPFGDVEDIIDIIPDGRKKEDLEIVKVSLKEIKPKQKEICY